MERDLPGAFRGWNACAPPKKRARRSRSTGAPRPREARFSTAAPKKELFVRLVVHDAEPDFELFDQRHESGKLIEILREDGRTLVLDGD